ncbi:MAG: cell division topological specificity factor MinE [Anaerolineae bacterium]
MGWLDKLLGRSASSAEIAKNRLKVVLSYDRTNLTPDMLTTIQDEIVSAISRHLDIDRDGMTFSTQRGESGDHLVADIPIRGMRPSHPAIEAAAAVPGSGTTAPAKKKRKKH